MKKNTILFYVFFLVSASIYCQERSSMPIPKISSSILGELKVAVGWVKNPENQWVSRKNKIPFYIESNYNSLIDYENRGLGIDNFIFFQVRKISINGKDYVILIKKSNDGYYEYPSIKEGWKKQEEYLFYVLEESQFSKLHDIKDGLINYLDLDIKYYNSIPNYYDTDFLRSIENEVNRQIQKSPDNTGFKLVFHIAPYKEKGIVQFQIYMTYGSRGNLIGGIKSELELENPDRENRFEKLKLFGKPDLFKHCYYEAEYKDFSSFIKLN